jgi:hypothetical protein
LAAPQSQRDRFIETARELGCDEDEEAFRAKLRVIARQKPKDDPDPPPENEKAATKG